MEIFLGIITRQAIRRGAFNSVTDHIGAITRFIDNWNTDCQPFTWTKTADEIIPHGTRSKDTSFTRHQGVGKGLNRVVVAPVSHREAPMLARRKLSLLVPLFVALLARRTGLCRCGARRGARAQVVGEAVNRCPAAMPVAAVHQGVHALTISPVDNCAGLDPSELSGFGRIVRVVQARPSSAHRRQAAVSGIEEYLCARFGSCSSVC